MDSEELRERLELLRTDPLLTSREARWLIETALVLLAYTTDLTGDMELPDVPPYPEEKGK